MNFHLSSDKALEIGTLIADRYRVEQVLGSGGMGFVYLAADSLLADEKVAVKVLHAGFAEDKTQTARFLREVQLMRKINHKNVVRTYDVGTDGKHIYFTMEYVPGKQLEEVVGPSGMSFDDIPRYMLQICEGLHAIHAAGVIHRDLKPGNILVLPDGSIRITDFGVARPEVSNLTAHDEIVGSVCYMAPEMWLGQPLSIAVDLYALGVILYEMCTGDVPFDGDSPGALMRLHLDREPIPPRDRNTRTPPWLNKLVLRLLAKSPQDRPRDAKEVSDYIKTHAGSISIGAVTNDSVKAAAEFFHELESGLQPDEKEDSQSEAVPDDSRRIRRRTLSAKGVGKKSSSSSGSQYPRTDTLPEGSAKARMLTALFIAMWMLVCFLLYSAQKSYLDPAAYSDDLIGLQKFVTDAAKNLQGNQLEAIFLKTASLIFSCAMPMLGVFLLVPGFWYPLRVFCRGVGFLVFALLMLFASNLWTESGMASLTVATAHAALLATSDQLMVLGFLSPFGNSYQAFVLGDDSMALAVTQSAVTNLWLLFVLQLILLATIFIALYPSKSTRMQDKLSAMFPRLVLVVALMFLEGAAFGGTSDPQPWSDYFLFSARLSETTLLFALMNWLIVLLMLSRLFRTIDSRN